MAGQDLPARTSLGQLVQLIGRGEPVFVRWSRAPQLDLASDRAGRDALAGTELPGLPANPLRREEWWKDLPTALRAARRLYDYSHPRGPGARRPALGPDARTLPSHERLRHPDGR